MSHSFSRKTARISQQIDKILSQGTLNCIFLLFTCVPQNSDDREGITCAFSGWMLKGILRQLSMSYTFLVGPEEQN